MAALCVVVLEHWKNSEEMGRRVGPPPQLAKLRRVDCRGRRAERDILCTLCSPFASFSLHPLPSFLDPICHFGHACAAAAAAESPLPRKKKKRKELFLFRTKNRKREREEREREREQLGLIDMLHFLFLFHLLPSPLPARKKEGRGAAHTALNPK